MNPLVLQPFHTRLNAQTAEHNGQCVIAHYGDWRAEYEALRTQFGVLDLSSRGRLCLSGTDRKRFLHGQVTNEINSLQVGQGCYAALVTAKGKMVSDMNVYCLETELLLDLEPGLDEKVSQRLEKYIISEDVQVMNAAPGYGLLSVQGPRSPQLLNALDLGLNLPSSPLAFVRQEQSAFGEIYLVNQPRLGTTGFDWFVPSDKLASAAEKLAGTARELGGRWCGWDAFEIARVEAGIPRFDADMDESNLPPEAGLEGRALSYSKGCYIGQEVLARIRTYGQVAKTLRKLWLTSDLPALPKKGDLLFKDGKEVGYVTSAVASPAFQANVALGYVRRESNALGTELRLLTAGGEWPARVAGLPFSENFA